MTDAIEPRDTPDDRARLDSSLTLLERARAGDRTAVEALIARYLPRMRRWATGRLPPWARDMADTHDLVQETLFQTFRRIDRFDPRGEGALQAYRSPLEAAIGTEALERYERALSTLRPEDGELVVAKIELGYTNQEIADLFGKPTANAARMAVERDVVRLAKEMSKPVE